MGRVKSHTIGSGTAYWVEDDSSRASSPDTTTYQTYAAKDDPRLYCDKCSRCILYNCDGTTARHHFIHIDAVEYFSRDGMQTGTDNPEHPDRDSGV